MTTPPRQRCVDILLERHGRTFADELGADVERNKPSPLFRLLCFSLLASTRISADIAMDAAHALSRHRWRTARTMASATWKERTDVLNHAGYARYDESTSRMLADTAQHLLDKYGGDLRRLREEAGHDVGRERQLLKECKGLGDAGVDIFMREAQASWDELYPFADKVALKAAGRLQLADNAEELAELVPKRQYPALVAALVRTHLRKDYESVLDKTG